MTDVDGVLETLRERVQTAIGSLEHPEYVADVRIDDKVARVETRPEPLAPITDDTTVDSETLTREGQRYKVLEGTSDQGVAQHLESEGFAVIVRRRNTIDIKGWPGRFDELREGDFVRLWKWKTPVRVTGVFESGEPYPDESLSLLPEDGLTVALEGSRGGQYALHRPESGDNTQFWHKGSSDSHGLTKPNDDASFQFVGNIETGPRQSSQ